MSLAHFKKRPAPPLDTTRANALDAETVAGVLGLDLKIQGRHVETTDKQYRGTEKDGRWVWCYRDGSGLGDTIALAMDVSGLDFVGAVKLLLAGGTIAPRPLAQQPAKPLELPRPGNAAEGRAYLVSRGIPQETINAAEAAGFIHFMRGAVAFVARDPAGQVKAITRRGYMPHDPTPKRDLKGSDKSWAGILPGSKTVWLVEGGVDALAVWSTGPTVVVTGGAGCRAFLGRDHAQALLKSAGRVVVACEHEKDAETQAVTDAQHQQQADLIREITGQQPVLWWPPSGCKDVADYIKSKGLTAPTVRP